MITLKQASERAVREQPDRIIFINVVHSAQRLVDANSMCKMIK